MAGKSPTENSLAILRAQGYDCWVVEYWNSFTKRRVDLYNAFDIMAVREGEVLLVQTTSGSNVSARIRKISDNPHMQAIRSAGIRCEIHGWRKAPKVKGGKAQIWKQRIVDIS